MTDTPKVPDAPETIIELVETFNIAWLIVAALIGAAIVAGLVAYIGREQGE